ncbi:MAG TPA: hypothetical protein VGK90_08120 [Rhizomicrobium sp.]|jgi:hypothetical protein
MEQGTPSQPWHWNEMLEEFCALGGAAKNIVPGSGRSGAGLFANKPLDEVLLRVPRNLLLRLDDIEFIDGQSRVRETARISESERRFFERYQAAFSWGAEGRAKTVAFITALEALPAEIRELLIADFAMGYLLEGDQTRRIQIQFLASRAVRWQDGRVIAPVLELANFGVDGLRCERGLHLQIQGYAHEEVTIRHVAEDACATFSRIGAAYRQPVAFSFPITVRIEDREIVIGRNTGEGVMRGRDRVPAMTVDDHRITLSHLMLGHGKNPRLPRGTFRTLLREVGLSNADGAFDRIVRFNALKLIGLLKALEPHEGPLIAALRAMARYQLEAMNDCVGSRDLAPAALSTGEL